MELEIRSQLRDLGFVMVSYISLIDYKGHIWKPDRVCKLIARNPKTPRDFIGMYFNRPEEAKQFVQQCVILNGGVIKQVLRSRASKLNFEYLEGNQVVPLLCTNSGKIVFYSNILKRVVPFCKSRFKELHNWSTQELERSMVEVEIIHDLSKEDGIYEGILNCTTAAPWVFP